MGNMKSSKKTWKEWELEEAHTQFETDFLPIDDIYKDFTPTKTSINCWMTTN